VQREFAVCRPPIHDNAVGPSSIPVPRSLSAAKSRPSKELGGSKSKARSAAFRRVVVGLDERGVDGSAAWKVTLRFEARGATFSLRSRRTDVSDGGSAALTFLDLRSAWRRRSPFAPTRQVRRGLQAPGTPTNSSHNVVLSASHYVLWREHLRSSSRTLSGFSTCR
jgi:hypothetical protein